MKIAIIGGKSLLDTVFLSNLSEEFPNLDVSCFLDSGEVSFGSRRLVVKDINELKVNNFNIIINLSKNYEYMLEGIKSYNEQSNSKIRYFNLHGGSLSINEITKKLEDIILLPAFGVEPICRLLSLLEGITSLNIFMNQPIAELGKEAMNQFYKEIKESGFRIVQQGETNKDPLAFNISFDYIEDESVGAFQDSIEENLVKKQISTFFEEIPILINQARVPVNKGASVLLNFELKSNISEDTLKNKFEKAGFLYGKYGVSTIITENDSAIYITKLKKIGKKYSIILLFDSIQRFTSNLTELLLGCLVTKN